MAECELPRLRRPCDECPWRLDAQPGRFDRERWEALRESSHNRRRGSADMTAPMFACHKTAEGGERACAGWLAQEGAGHVGIRITVLQGRLPAEALSPGPDWPALHESFADAAAHDLEEEVDLWT